jgi:hypothetical protein
MADIVNSLNRLIINRELCLIVKVMGIVINDPIIFQGKSLIPKNIMNFANPLIVRIEDENEFLERTLDLIKDKWE